MPDTLTRHQPAAALDRFHDTVDRLFRDRFVLPPFQRLFDGFNRMGSTLVEKDDAYIVQIALPGLDYENADIRVIGNRLTIKGRYTVPSVEDGTILWRGIPHGELSEVVRLPADVSGDNAEAIYDRGILTVTLPKSLASQVHTIKVTPAV